MYGLILEGGGARGAYHIGAYKALVAEGIEIAGVAGTSIGALNGAMIIQGDHEKAYHLWNNITYSKIIDTDDEIIEEIKKLKLDKENISFILEKVKTILSEKGLNITPLKEMMLQYIDEDKIRASGKDFALVTVSLTDWKPVEIYIEDIAQGKLHEYILASAYLPIFKTEKLNGKIYLDGSVYNNLPINLLKDKGYKNLITIRTKPSGSKLQSKLDALNIINISPRKELSRTIDFDQESVRYNLKLGYYDALKVLKNLQGFNYYFKPKKNKNYFIKHLINLTDEKVKKLAEIFNINKRIPSQRALFEIIIPKLSNLLEIEKEADYDQIFYHLLEKLAGIYEIDKFKIYTYENLEKKIKENLDLEVTKESDYKEEIIKSLDFLTLFHKEELLKEIGKFIL